MRRFLLLVFVCSAIPSFSQKYKTRNVLDHWETVVNATDTWRYFIGTTNPDSTWYKYTFDDSAWSKGKGGFGYGDGDDSTSISSAALSVYSRIRFVIKDTSKIYDALLNVDYDDGFVIWLNGVEVARKNLGTKGDFPAYNTAASAEHEAQLYQGGQPDYITLKKYILKQALKKDTNVLCVQVNNIDASSSDLTSNVWFTVGLNDTAKVYKKTPSWFTPEFVTHLPIIKLNTNGQGIPDAYRITAQMGIIYDGFQLNHYSDSANDYNGKITIEVRGSSSSGFPQQSYGLSTVDSNGNNRNVKLLGMPKENDWILFAPYTDKSLMRNNLVYDIGRLLGSYAPRCRFVELVTNDQYMGIYVLMEKLKIDANRVNIPQIDTSIKIGDALTGGYLMKVDRIKESGLGYWKSPITTYNSISRDYSIQTVEPSIPDITQKQVTYIKGWMDQFENVLNGNGYTNNNTGYRKYIDVQSFIDYYILNEWTKNVDRYRLSTFLFKQRNSLGGRLYCGPLWDFNLGAGNADYCNAADTTGWDMCSMNNVPFWFERLLADNDYKKQLACRWKTIRATLLSNNWINDYIDSTAEYLEIPQRRHYVKWPILGVYVWPNAYIGATYKQEVAYLKKWVRGRSNWMDKNLPKPPATCTSANNGQIVFSEINYNCHPKFNGGNWVELYNKTGNSINVSNFVLRINNTNLSYTIPNNTFIPSSGYLVIVEDSNAFKKIYPTVKNFVGPTNWSLSNSSNTLTLHDAYSFQAAKVTYDDKWPWPQGADGHGPTLEYWKLAGTPDAASSWVDGCFGGSPGAKFMPCNKLLINEINYSSAKNMDAGDWVELYNNDTVAINFSGYILKDDNDSSFFKFTNGTIIQSHDYVVLCNDTVKFKSQYPNVKYYPSQLSFGLSAKADAVRLFTPDTLLYSSVWYSDSFPFPYGAKGTGNTIERIDSMMNVGLPASWALSCPGGTPGSKRNTNCFPVTKFKLNELSIFPHPLQQDGRWVEVINTDTAPVTLDHWEIRTATNQKSINLGTGITINAGDYLVICADTMLFKKYHPNAKNYIGNINFNPTDSLRFFTDFGLRTQGLYIDSNWVVWGAKYTGKTTERKSLTLADSTTGNWLEGCLLGSPAQAYSPCILPNYISEINYHSASTKDAGDWVEIYNPTLTTIDLSGWKIYSFVNNAIATIPANVSLNSASRKVFVHDDILFHQVHPFIDGYQGVPLASGDVVSLFDSMDHLMYSLKYDTKGQWTDSADGKGYTIELTKDTNDAGAWHSFCLNGSPGRAYGMPCQPGKFANIYYTEINYKNHSNFNSGNWFELYNSQLNDVDVSNWGITNSKGEMVYKYEEGSKLMGKAYQVLAADTALFNSMHGVSNYMSGPLLKNINSNADTLQLRDYSGYIVSEAAYSAGSDWPVAANGFGKTMERIDTNASAKQASSWFNGCVGGSPGFAFTPCTNHYISEINYHSNSVGNAGDWFEVHNSTSQPLSISSIYFTTQNCEVNTSAISYSLNANGYVAIVNDSNLFKQRNPTVKNYIYIPGWFLSDTSDFVLVYDKNTQQLLQTYYYEADTPWHTLAAGKGYTLELKNAYPDVCAPAAWFIGCPEGSAGDSFSMPCAARNIGLSATEFTHYKLFPNPAHQYIYIENNAAQVKQERFCIYDIQGKLCVDKLFSGSDTVSLFGLASGIYVYRMGNGYGKLVIE
jgi:hypothetical protein